MNLLIMVAQGAVLGLATTELVRTNFALWVVVIVLNPVLTIAYHEVRSRYGN